MPRWEPDARERLVIAALQLFSEQGYDETTVAQIAERSGVSSSTFHRHFPDKRDILAAGQEALSRLLTEGIAEARADASPLDAVSEGLTRAASLYKPERSALVAAAVAASTELQARAALKQVGTTKAMADALVARGVAVTLARLAAEVGALALKGGFAAWIADGADRDLGELMRTELRRLQASAAEL
jgi:AcrR family transcriptional regulator